MVFLEGFVSPEKILQTDEIKPLKKSNFRRNLMNAIMGMGLLGIVGQGAYSCFRGMPEVKEQNPLESYFCVENIKPRWEENLKTYANQIVWENPDKKFIENDVFNFLVKFNGKFLVKSNGKIDGSVGMGEDILIPVYSMQVCRRLGRPEN